MSLHEPWAIKNNYLLPVNWQTHLVLQAPLSTCLWRSKINQAIQGREKKREQEGNIGMEPGPQPLFLNHIGFCQLQIELIDKRHGRYISAEVAVRSQKFVRATDYLIILRKDMNTNRRIGEEGGPSISWSTREDGEWAKYLHKHSRATTQSATGM